MELSLREEAALTRLGEDDLICESNSTEENIKKISQIYADEFVNNGRPPSMEAIMIDIQDYNYQIFLNMSKDDCIGFDEEEIDEYIWSLYTDFFSYYGGDCDELVMKIISALQLGLDVQNYVQEQSCFNDAVAKEVYSSRGILITNERMYKELLPYDNNIILVNSAQNRVTDYFWKSIVQDSVEMALPQSMGEVVFYE